MWRCLADNQKCSILFQMIHSPVSYFRLPGFAGNNSLSLCLRTYMVICGKDDDKMMKIWLLSNQKFHHRFPVGKITAKGCKIFFLWFKTILVFGFVTDNVFITQWYYTKKKKTLEAEISTNTPSHVTKEIVPMIIELFLCEQNCCDGKTLQRFTDHIFTIQSWVA